jgi:hypothetical protein
MPTYFFNVPGTSIDDAGADLPNDEAAWKEATVAAGAIFKDIDGSLRPGQAWELEVSTEKKSTFFRIRISTEKIG